MDDIRGKQIRTAQSPEKFIGSYKGKQKSGKIQHLELNKNSLHGGQGEMGEGGQQAQTYSYK